MLFKFFLLALPILVQCAKGSNGGGSPNDNFDCICRPIPGNTNNEYNCKCRSSEAAPTIDQPNNQLPAAGTPPPVGTPPPNNGGAGGGTGNAGAGAGGTGINQNGGAGGGGANPAPAAPAAPAADQGDPLDQPFGDTYTYVMCLKRAAGADIKTKPVWDWLARDSGNVKIKGKWMKYSCSYGVTNPFFVLPAAYQKVLDLCKEKGYENAQPADSIASNYYPFQIDQQLTEYFHQTIYVFSTTYDRYQQTKVDKC